MSVEVLNTTRIVLRVNNPGRTRGIVTNAHLTSHSFDRLQIKSLSKHQWIEPQLLIDTIVSSRRIVGSSHWFLDFFPHIVSISSIHLVNVKE